MDPVQLILDRFNRQDLDDNTSEASQTYNSGAQSATGS